jgi:hypothetical protein
MALCQRKHRPHAADCGAQAEHAVPGRLRGLGQGAHAVAMSDENRLYTRRQSSSLPAYDLISPRSASLCRRFTPSVSCRVSVYASTLSDGRPGARPSAPIAALAAISTLRGLASSGTMTSSGGGLPASGSNSCKRGGRPHSHLSAIGTCSLAASIVRERHDNWAPTLSLTRMRMNRSAEMLMGRGRLQ